MNNRQRTVLFIAAGVFLLTLLFPIANEEHRIGENSQLLFLLSSADSYTIHSLAWLTMFIGEAMIAATLYFAFRDDN